MEEDFRFYEKEWKGKIAFSTGLAVSCYRRSTIRKLWVAPPVPSRGNRTQHVSVSRQGFELCVFIRALPPCILCIRVS